jgi:DNA-binding IclR family transcriptional regulator
MSKTVERALSILIYIGKSERYPTMSNICRELDIPKASASDLLHTLLDYGFIRIKDPERMTLALGEQVLQLGSAYRRQTEFLPMIHEGAKKLSADMGKTVFFWICQQKRMVLMDRALFQTGVYPNYEAGHTEPMESMIGRVYLTGEPSAEAAAGSRIGCYAVPVLDVDGRKAGVFSTYALSGEPRLILEQLAAGAAEVSGKIYAGF